MSERHLPVSLDELDGRGGHARGLSPMRSRGHQKPMSRSTRSSAKRSKRSKSATGGIHQRRNKRANW